MPYTSNGEKNNNFQERCPITAQVVDDVSRHEKQHRCSAWSRTHTNTTHSSKRRGCYFNRPSRFVSFLHCTEIVRSSHILVR